MKFKIVRANLADTKRLSELECKCYGCTWHPYANWFWKRAVEYMHAYKAMVGKKIVGGIVALVTRQGSIYVDTLFVVEPYRKLGIGRSLMGRILKVSDKNKVILDTWKSNETAMNLFSSLGFKRGRVLKNYYEEKMDYVMFEKPAETR